MNGVVRDTADAPEQRVGNDAVAVRDVIDASVGCEAFSLRVLRAVRGRSFERVTGAGEELLFVVTGHGGVIVDGADARELEPETGVLLRRGTRYELDNDSDEDLVIVSVALHREPLPLPLPLPADAASEPLVARLADAAEGSATADRTFRVVFDAEHGCGAATQFVGYIPVGAAPRHYHLYEEVIYILDGDGVMHMNDALTPLRGGTCIHLPPRKLHTLENSGPGVMRILGVFRPAGSPAAAFYPDGTPAHTADEPQAVSTAQ
jgi:mannose-6-phosphate isomerase-like protein (cupin superfamily)